MLKQVVTSGFLLAVALGRIHVEPAAGDIKSGLAIKAAAAPVVAPPVPEQPAKVAAPQAIAKKVEEVKVVETPKQQEQAKAPVAPKQQEQVKTPVAPQQQEQAKAPVAPKQQEQVKTPVAPQQQGQVKIPLVPEQQKQIKEPIAPKKVQTAQEVKEKVAHSTPKYPLGPGYANQEQNQTEDSARKIAKAKETAKHVDAAEAIDAGNKVEEIEQTESISVDRRRGRSRSREGSCDRRSNSRDRRDNSHEHSQNRRQGHEDSEYEGRDSRPDRRHEHHHEHHHGHDDEHCHFRHSHNHKVDHLKVGGSWTTFLFGDAGEWVKTDFVFRSKVPTFLKLTDYYCSGDQFEIYDNGKCIGKSSHPTFDECASKTYDPDHAFYNEPWSSFSAPLDPGCHSITIKVLKSPYHEGYAAIRVDPVYNKCCLSLSGLTLLNTPVPFKSAEFACEAFGLKLADIDINNFNDATKVVFGCGGASSSAYIKSYWGNNYQDSCLALYTGSSAPGGAISTPGNCHKHMPVLCQGETKSCHGHFLRA